MARSKSQEGTRRMTSAVEQAPDETLSSAEVLQLGIRGLIKRDARNRRIAREEILRQLAAAQGTEQEGRIKLAAVSDATNIDVGDVQLALGTLTGDGTLEHGPLWSLVLAPNRDQPTSG